MQSTEAVAGPDTTGQNPAPEPAAETQRSIARAATITAIGNISSRIIGLVREGVKSNYFGNGPAASAFEQASNLPTQFNDLLIGGMLSSALVPTFSALADDGKDPAKMREFGALLGALIGIVTLGLTVLVGALLLFAEPIAALYSGQRLDQALVAQLLRITLPTIIFLNMDGVLTAALYARKKFAIVAFTATAFNLTMIACMILFRQQLGVHALAIGMLAASVVQVVMQIPGLRGIPIKISLNWRLPGLWHIVRLFLPVAGGLALAQVAVSLSFIFAARISGEASATMRYAAQVIQFPLGMVVVAVSSAILPTLSAQAAHASLDDFKATLAQGLKLVSVLILPASIGLTVLAQPIIGLLFQRGEFTTASTLYTAPALLAAIPGLIFAAIDQPLIFSFYALRDTRTPTLIGLVSTVFYLVLVAILAWLDRTGIRLFELTDLVLANSVKTGVDAALMGWFLNRKVHGMRGFGFAALGAKVLAASLVMGGGVWLTATTLMARLGTNSFLAHLTTSVVGALVGVAIYLAGTRLLKIEELNTLRSLLRRRA